MEVVSYQDSGPFGLCIVPIMPEQVADDTGKDSEDDEAGLSMC